MSTTEEPDTSTGTEGGQVSPADQKPSGTSEREYLIFEQQRENGPWDQIDRVTASDVKGALNTLGDKSKKTSNYVAVAERYWQPMSPQVETQTTITWK